MTRITVPDVPAPTFQLCWKQAQNMERCDRRKGHGGPHTWDLEGYRALIAAQDAKEKQWAMDRAAFRT